MQSFNTSINRADPESLVQGNDLQEKLLSQKEPDAYADNQISLQQQKPDADNGLLQGNQRKQQQANLEAVVQDNSQGKEAATEEKYQFGLLTDQRTALENFPTNPTQFKVNKSQTKMYVINKTNDQTSIKIYSLPDFAEQVTVQPPSPSEDLNKIMAKLNFLDVSEDEKFIVFGNNDNLILCSTSFLFPDQKPQEEQKFGIMKMALTTNQENAFGVRFTENNELILVSVIKDSVKVQQTTGSAQDLLNYREENKIFEVDSKDSKIFQEISMKQPSQSLNNTNTTSSQFNIFKFSSCFYIRSQDCLYIYKPKDKQSKDQQNGMFWDPINGNQVNSKNSRGPTGAQGTQQMAQNQSNLAANSDPFVGIAQCFVQDGVLLIQYKAKYIQIYTQKMGQTKGKIEQQKNKIDLTSSSIIEEGMIAFRLYQGNLYFKNDSDNKYVISVVSFSNSKLLKKLWNFQSDQKFTVDPEYQLQTTHYIHFIQSQNGSLQQINGFSNELIFNQVWSNLRPKYAVIANGKVFQDGENDGSLIIQDQNGIQYIKTFEGPSANLNRYKNYIKNIYYSEELDRLVLLKSYDDQSSLKEQIFLMSTNGPADIVDKENQNDPENQQPRKIMPQNQNPSLEKKDPKQEPFKHEKLSGEYSNQHVEIIGTLQDPSLDGQVLLFVLKASQNLIMYKIKVKIQGEIKVFELDENYINIEKADQITKQDIFLDKMSKQVVVKMPDTGTESTESSNYKIYYNLETKTNPGSKSNSKLPYYEQKIQKGHRLIKVKGPTLYFLNNDQQEISTFDKPDNQVSSDSPPIQSGDSQQKQEGPLNTNQQSAEKVSKKGAEKDPRQNVNFRIFQQAIERTQKQGDTEEKNERLIWTQNFIICQNETTIYIFDAEDRLLKCQINNAPPDCSFIRTSDIGKDIQQFYLIAKSSIDGLIDIKAFKIIKDQKLLKLNDKEQPQPPAPDPQPPGLQPQLPTENSKESAGKRQGPTVKPLVIEIPREFQLSSDTFLIYDFIDPRVELYNSPYENEMELIMWTNLQSRSIISKSKIKDLIKKVNFGKKTKDSSQSTNMSEILFFDTLHRKSILHLVYDNELSFTAALNIFNGMKEEDLPFLMFEDENGNTPLDLVVEKMQQKSIVSLLNLIVYHKSAAKQYNRHIDKHLITLIEMELNLKDLFESEILYSPITSYKSQEKDRPELVIYPVLKQFQSEVEVTADKQDQILMNNLAVPQQIVQSAQLEETQQNQTSSQEYQYPVEYNLIDMKQTLNAGFGNKGEISKTLMVVLEKQTRQDIFEFTCIQRIIDYKWLAYTQDYFKREFYWFTLLCGLFYLSIFMQQAIMEEDLTKETLIIAGYDFGDFQFDVPIVANIILTVGYIMISIKFLIIEIKQILRAFQPVQPGQPSQLAEHFGDFYNMNDLPLFVLLLIQGSLSIFQIVDLQSTLMKLLKCIIILQIFIKLNYFLRIYDQFSFLVSMLKVVFIDLAAFSAFFLMVVAVFSCLIQVLLPESQVNYEGAGYFSYLMMAFRGSIGDYTFDSYKATSMKEVTWLLWFGLTIIGNVVFMNFIIAVVNDSYSNSMAKQVSSQYRLKVDLIKEMEAQLAYDKDILQEKKQIMMQLEKNEAVTLALPVYLPNYIVVKTSSTASDTPNDQVSFQTQIQKTVDEIKRTQKQQGEVLNKIVEMLSQPNSIPRAITASEDGSDFAPVLKTQLSKRQ